jgi:hypothetical protein
MPAAKPHLAILALALGLGLTAAEARDGKRYWDWDETDLHTVDSEEIRRSFAGGAGPLQVEVDNWNGAITVTAHDAPSVELVARRTNRARSAAKLQEAKQAVRLDIREEPGLVRLYVDGPFRARDRSKHHKGTRWYGWKVDIDFELRVPRHAAVTLRTVSDGDIRTTGVHGGFDVENINGGVEMLDMGGAGRVYSMNGAVLVRFERNPSADSYFGALNGDLDIEFRADLAAQLHFETFNGEVYSDFEVVPLEPGPAPPHERRGGRNRYRTEKSFGVQVGGGGPRLDFDAFNGDIRIARRER